MPVLEDCRSCFRSQVLKNQNTGPKTVCAQVNSVQHSNSIFRGLKTIPFLGLWVLFNAQIHTEHGFCSTIL